MNQRLRTKPGKTVKAETGKGVALPEVLHQSSGEIKYRALGSHCHVLLSSIAFERRGGEMFFISSWICSLSLLSFRAQPGPLLRFPGVAEKGPADITGECVGTDTSSGLVSIAGRVGWLQRSRTGLEAPLTPQAVSAGISSTNGREKGVKILICEQFRRTYTGDC